MFSPLRARQSADLTPLPTLCPEVNAHCLDTIVSFATVGPVAKETASFIRLLRGPLTRQRAVKRYVNDQTEFARMRVCACCGLRDPIGLLLQTGDYREVKYSAVNSDGALACKIFANSLGHDVKQYIVAGLRACVESAGRCHSVAGLARSIDAAAHELCFATDERASANVRSASCLSGCGVSTDASSASRAPNLPWTLSSATLY